jgi:hypothetical protein
LLDQIEKILRNHEGKLAPDNSAYSNHQGSPYTTKLETPYKGSPAKSNLSDGPIDYSARKKTELKTIKYLADWDKEISWDKMSAQ